MLEFKKYSDVPKDFTGFCKILWDMSIRYYQNGFYHREDGPAVEYANGDKDWFYKGEFYGFNDNFTIESWKEKVEELIRKEKLKIFK